MTVFDKVDPYRFRIRGIWEEKRVWINGVELRAPKRSWHNVGGFYWTTTVTEYGESLINLATAISNYIYNENRSNVETRIVDPNMWAIRLVQSLPKDFDVVVNSETGVVRNVHTV